MTALAFLAEPTLMYVIMRMTFHAFRRCAVEGQRRVTLRATYHTVQSQQRIAREIMIENDIGVPSLLAVAGIAAAFELAAVRIFTAMTPHAILGQFLGFYRRGVTDMAINLGVLTH